MADMNFATLEKMFEKAHEQSVLAVLRVIYILANEENHNFQGLAAMIEAGWKADIPAVVALKDYLAQVESLKDETFLTDDLIRLHLTNAQHRLEVLHSIATTGKDPTKEPDVTFEPWKG